ncbi:MAG: BON domain-containing protein [Bacteroidales bacterium]
MNPTNDEMKKQDIVDELIWDDSVDANDVTVTVHNGTVELNGSVPTFAAKAAAERDAYLASDVTAVINNLTVKFPSTRAIPTDAEITTNIENKLNWNSQVNASGIIVQTTNGIVNLSGVVDTYWEKSLAEDVALYTDGVIDVINDLTVTPVKSIVDIDIENDIKKAFTRNSIIDETNISVNVNEGVVTLSGVASSYLEKSRAYNIAKYTAGVVNVVDNITIA